MDKEIWKGIPGYKGLYEVSDLGRVYSSHTHKILNPGKHRDGYLQIILHKEGVKTFYRIHILVMLTFVGKCPQGKEVAHNNGDPSNNKLTNLRYATHRENQQDRVKHGTDNKGVKNGRTKLTEEKVKEIRQKAKYYTQAKLAKEYGIAICTISYIIARKTWRHIL